LFDTEEQRYRETPEGKLLHDAHHYTKSPYKQGLVRPSDFYRFEDDDDLQYFELQRQYTPTVGRLLSIFTLYRGWLRHGALIRSMFVDDDSYFMHTSGVKPLGTVAIDTAHFVIVLEHGYESVGLAIEKISKLGLERVLDISMGGC
jgi:hypothetical protein